MVMDKYVPIKPETLTNIADAVRSKTGENAEMTPDEMAATLEALNITLQEKTVTPTTETQTITADEGYYGLSSVTVEAAESGGSGGSGGSEYGIISMTGTFDDCGSGAMEAINRYIANEDLEITGLRVYDASDAGSESRQLVLYDENKNVLVRTSSVSPPLGEWAEANFSPPVTIAAGKTFYVGTTKAYYTSLIGETNVTFNEKITFNKSMAVSPGQWPTWWNGYVRGIVDIIIG